MGADYLELGAVAQAHPAGGAEPEREPRTSPKGAQWAQSPGRLRAALSSPKGRLGSISALCLRRDGTDCTEAPDGRVSTLLAGLPPTGPEEAGLGPAQPPPGQHICVPPLRSWTAEEGVKRMRKVIDCPGQFISVTSPWGSHGRDPGGPNTEPAGPACAGSFRRRFLENVNRQDGRGCLRASET